MSFVNARGAHDNIVWPLVPFVFFISLIILGHDEDNWLFKLQNYSNGWSQDRNRTKARTNRKSSSSSLNSRRMCYWVEISWKQKCFLQSWSMIKHQCFCGQTGVFHLMYSHSQMYHAAIIGATVLFCLIVYWLVFVTTTTVTKHVDLLQWFWSTNITLKQVFTNKPTWHINLSYIYLKTLLFSS